MQSILTGRMTICEGTKVPFEKKDTDAGIVCDWSVDRGRVGQSKVWLMLGGRRGTCHHREATMGKERWGESERRKTRWENGIKGTKGCPVNWWVNFIGG